MFHSTKLFSFMSKIMHPLLFYLQNLIIKIISLSPVHILLQTQNTKFRNKYLEAEYLRDMFTLFSHVSSSRRRKLYLCTS